MPPNCTIPARNLQDVRHVTTCDIKYTKHDRQNYQPATLQPYSDIPLSGKLVTSTQTANKRQLTGPDDLHTHTTSRYGVSKRKGRRRAPQPVTWVSTGRDDVRGAIDVTRITTNNHGKIRWKRYRRYKFKLTNNNRGDRSNKSHFEHPVTGAPTLNRRQPSLGRHCHRHLTTNTITNRTGHHIQKGVAPSAKAMV